MFDVFGNPYLGLVVAVISMVGIWLFKILRPEKARWWQSFIPVMIFVLALGVDYFVKTDAEKIRAAISDGIKAFKQQKIEPIEQMIADDYSDDARSGKQLILAYCKALFVVTPVEKVTMLSKAVNVEGSKGDFTSKAAVKFAKQSEIAQAGKEYMLVKFRVYFRKTPDGKWLIYSTDILEIDQKPVNWKQIDSI